MPKLHSSHTSAPDVGILSTPAELSLWFSAATMLVFFAVLWDSPLPAQTIVDPATVRSMGNQGSAAIRFDSGNEVRQSKPATRRRNTRGRSPSRSTRPTANANTELNHSTSIPTRPIESSGKNVSPTSNPSDVVDPLHVDPFAVDPFPLNPPSVHPKSSDPNAANSFGVDPFGAAEPFVASVPIGSALLPRGSAESAARSTGTKARASDVAASGNHSGSSESLSTPTDQSAWGDESASYEFHTLHAIVSPHVPKVAKAAADSRPIADTNGVSEIKKIAEPNAALTIHSDLRIDAAVNDALPLGIATMIALPAVDGNENFPLGQSFTAHSEPVGLLEAGDAAALLVASTSNAQPAAVESPEKISGKAKPLVAKPMATKPLPTKPLVTLAPPVLTPSAVSAPPLVAASSFGTDVATPVPSGVSVRSSLGQQGPDIRAVARSDSKEKRKRASNDKGVSVVKSTASVVSEDRRTVSTSPPLATNGSSLDSARASAAILEPVDAPQSMVTPQRVAAAQPKLTTLLTPLTPRVPAAASSSRSARELPPSTAIKRPMPSVPIARVVASTPVGARELTPPTAIDRPIPPATVASVVASTPRGARDLTPPAALERPLTASSPTQHVVASTPTGARQLSPPAAIPTAVARALERPRGRPQLRSSNGTPPATFVPPSQVAVLPKIPQRVPRSALLQPQLKHDGSPIIAQSLVSANAQKSYSGSTSERVIRTSLEELIASARPDVALDTPQTAAPRLPETMARQAAYANPLPKTAAPSRYDTRLAPDVVAATSLTSPTSPNVDHASDLPAGYGEVADTGAVNWSELSKWAEPKQAESTFRTVGLLTVISLAPAILLMTTSFIRISVVLGLLRQAIGTQMLPSNQIVTSLAMFLTALVMMPVWHQVYEEAIVPYTDQAMTAEQAWQVGVQPVRAFMSRQIELAYNSEDVLLFHSYLPDVSQPPETYEDVPLHVLLPAFMISELKIAFLIGFQIYLPFLIIDLVVSSVTVSMGMMMLPPITVSLPLKLLLFVLVDGWHLVVEMLLQSFGGFS